MYRKCFQGLALVIGLSSASNVFGQYGYGNMGASSFPVDEPQSILQNLPQVPQHYGQQNLAPRNYGPGNQAGQPYSQPNYASQNLAGQNFPSQNYPSQGATQQFQLVASQDQNGGGQYYEENLNLGQNPQVAPQLNEQQAQGYLTNPGSGSQQYQAQQANSLPAPSVAPPAPGYASPSSSGYAQHNAMGHGYAQSIAPNCTTCGPEPISQPNAFGSTSLFNGGYFGGHGRHFGGLPGGAKPWFFGVDYMHFNRVDDENQPLSLRDSNLEDVLSTGDAQMDAMSGVQVFGGRYFNCGKNAIQVGYWGLFPDTEAVSIVGAAPGDYRARHLVLGDVWMPIDPTGAAGAFDAYDWYDNGSEHRVERSSVFHNLEVNLLGFAAGGAARNFNHVTSGSLFSGHQGRGARGNCGYCGGAGCGSCSSPEPTRFATGPCCYTAPSCGSRLNMSWLAGFRYFRFEDNLQFASSFNNDGITRAIDDIYYDVNTTNDLVGVQTGGRLDYCITRRINLYGTTKVGVYNNRANLYSRIGTDTAVAYDASFTSVNYLVDETDNRVAFLSEIGAGFGVRISPKWTLTTGYQAVIASGVATSVGNLRGPRDFVLDQAHINNTDTLILHGLQVGATYNF